MPHPYNRNVHSRYLLREDDSTARIRVRLDSEQADRIDAAMARLADYESPVDLLTDALEIGLRTLEEDLGGGQ